MLEEGKPAPSFTLRSDTGEDISLDSQGNMGFVGFDYPFGIILKYSPTGRYLWAKGLDTTGGNSCAFGSDDSLAVADRARDAHSVARGRGGLV